MGFWERPSKRPSFQEKTKEEESQIYPRDDNSSSF